jgi:hypothetical protein
MYHIRFFICSRKNYFVENVEVVVPFRLHIVGVQFIFHDVEIVGRMY